VNPARADDYIHVCLKQLNETLATFLEGDVIMMRSPIRFGLDDVVRLEIEALHERTRRKRKLPKLVVILETGGGYIEIVERLYNIFRNHYRLVDFIIPNFAYSAGTVLALSGDSIFMDYYSVLGPIDPQYETDDGRYVPGLGYLYKFEELKNFINGCSGKPDSYRSELAYLLKKFDPGVLFHLEQSKNHSISLLETWLPRHKFKNWKVTQTTRKRVTLAYRKKRATQIAEILSDPARWHSHGRGIGLRELTSREINLKIENFGINTDLNSKIRQYYDLVIDYAHKIGCGDMRSTVIHSQNGLRRIASMA